MFEIACIIICLEYQLHVGMDLGAEEICSECVQGRYLYVRHVDRVDMPKKATVFFLTFGSICIHLSTVSKRVMS